MKKVTVIDTSFGNTENIPMDVMISLRRYHRDYIERNDAYIEGDFELDQTEKPAQKWLASKCLQPSKVLFFYSW